MSGEPIRANCEGCGAKVFLVKTTAGAMVPIAGGRITILTKTHTGWVQGAEGYALHVCPKKN